VAASLSAAAFCCSRFIGLLGRPAVALAAHREVIPVILRLVLSEQFHEITPKQPARKQLACSAARIRAEQQHRTSNCIRSQSSQGTHLRIANARTLRPWWRVDGRIVDTRTGSHELCQPFSSYAAAYSHRSLPPASVEYEQPHPRRMRVWTSSSEPCTLLISTKGEIYA